MASESEGEDGFEQMIADRNRKHKKAGGWQAMGLDRNVSRGIERKGYRVPTPIQRKSIPLLLTGKDCLCMARTGSGKTAAFVVPMLQKLKCRSGASGFRALLISPTRELALQTFKFVKELGKYTGLRAAVLVGGEALDAQFGAIHENPDIVIGTPGRLMHVVVEMNLRLTQVEYVVFDEADRLFEMGLAEQLLEVLHRLPDSRQTTLFSATLPKMLVDFAKAGLTDPVLVRLDVDSKISEQLDQVWLYCRSDDKIAVYLHLLQNVIDTNAEQTIVFCATKHYVDLLTQITTEAGFACTYLYSDLDAGCRKLHMSRFRERRCNILIVTDVAARGVDIPLLDNVINVHFPARSKLFVHRVGRVARAGRRGRALSLVAPDELAYLLDLCLFLNRPLLLGAGREQLGAVPQHVVDAQMQILVPIVDNHTAIQDQQRVAANSLKQYIKSRPVASTESIARIKTEYRAQLAGLQPSWIFANVGVDSEVPDANAVHTDMLQKLKNYKAKTTVFEAFCKAHSSQREMMQAKRRLHEKYVKHDDVSVTAATPSVSAAATTQPDAVTESDIKSVFSGSPEVKPKQKRKLKAAQHNLAAAATKKPKITASRRDEANFVKYTPADFHSEQGLSVDRASFDRQARDAVVDFTGDDDQSLRRQKGVKKWDRKKKKFVGDAGNQGKAKKVKTEDGRWVAAGLKSGAYDKWRKKQQLQTELAADEDTQQLSRARPNFGGKAVKSQGATTTKGGRPVRSELKTKEQILKVRNKKARVESFQKSRQKDRQHRKAHTKTRGGPKKSR